MADRSRDRQDEEEPLTGLTIDEFLERAGSASPTPGGGGIAALAGAAAVSMLEMTLNFTVGKPKFAAVQERAKSLLATVSAARKTLTHLVNDDAAAYAKVSAAVKMPGGTPAEKDARRAAVNAGMREALKPPLETLRTLARVAADASEILAIGNPNLASDTGVAAALLPGAALAAALNVWMNVSALDAGAAAQVTAEVAAAMTRIDDACRTVRTQVESKLCPKTSPDSTSR